MLALRALFLFCPALYLFSANPASGPAPADEQLHYSVNWPSGLSLGEAQLKAHRTAADGARPERMEYSFTIDASVPAFGVFDRYLSETSADACSVEFSRFASHGKKKADEKVVFDQKAGTAVRETSAGGGKTTLSLPVCAKDALAFLFSVRRELAQGRLPPPQQIVFGAIYNARVEFRGSETVRVGESKVDADRLFATIKGPASEISFDIFFAKDPARTPVLVRVPLPLGIFSMELMK